MKQPTRLWAILLIPALMVDPTWASVRSCATPTSHAASFFDTQAVAASRWGYTHSNFFPRVARKIVFTAVVLGISGLAAPEDPPGKGAPAFSQLNAVLQSSHADQLINLVFKAATAESAMERSEYNRSLDHDLRQGIEDPEARAIVVRHFLDLAVANVSEYTHRELPLYSDAYGTLLDDTLPHDVKVTIADEAATRLENKALEVRLFFENDENRWLSISLATAAREVEYNTLLTILEHANSDTYGKYLSSPNAHYIEQQQNKWGIRKAFYSLFAVFLLAIIVTLRKWKMGKQKRGDWALLLSIGLGTMHLLNHSQYVPRHKFSETNGARVRISYLKSAMAHRNRAVSDYA